METIMRHSIWTKIRTIREREMADVSQAGAGEGQNAAVADPNIPNAAALPDSIVQDKPETNSEEKESLDKVTAANGQVAEVNSSIPTDPEPKKNADVSQAGAGEGQNAAVADPNIPNAASLPGSIVQDKPETNSEEKESLDKVSAANGQVAEVNSSKPTDPEPKKNDDWEKREQELLKKIEELETVKSLSSEDGLKLELKIREEEIDLLKARVKNLETELQASLTRPGTKNQEIIDHIKQQHEELLTKARGMIFDKTKMVKNQELQIEALTTQVQSLKDINIITKDLLEIRNSEMKAMEDRLQAMEARFKAEKDRFTLMLQRAQSSTNLNDDLKKEYTTQLAIFKELREKYDQRVKALVSENAKLKDVIEAKTQQMLTKQ